MSMFFFWGLALLVAWSIISSAALLEGGKSKYCRSSVSLLLRLPFVNNRVFNLVNCVISLMFKMPNTRRKPFFYGFSMHCVCFATRDCCVPINAPTLHCTVHINLQYSRQAQVLFLVNTDSDIIFAVAVRSVPIRPTIQLFPTSN